MTEEATGVDVVQSQLLLVSGDPGVCYAEKVTGDDSSDVLQCVVSLVFFVVSISTGFR